MRNKKHVSSQAYTRVGLLINPDMLSLNTDDTIALVEESVLFSLIPFRHLYLVPTDKNLERIQNSPKLQAEKVEFFKKEHRKSCVDLVDRDYGGVIPVAPQYQRDTGHVAFGLKTSVNTPAEDFQLLHSKTENVHEATIVFAFFFQETFVPLRPGGSWDDMEWEQWGILDENAFTRCIKEIFSQVINEYGTTEVGDNLS